MSKAFVENQALSEVSLDIKPGEIHGLVGGNGSGKSTLIKIMAGVYAADQGDLETRGHVHDLRTFTPAEAHECGLRFVHQEESTFPDFSIADNLSIGRGYETGPLFRVRSRDVRARTKAVLDRFGVRADPDDLLGSLNPAAQTMVAVARALQDQDHADGGLLVLDEPTSALPTNEVGLLMEALQRYAAAGQAILFVSHRLDEVLSASDRVTVLRDGRKVGTVETAEIDHGDLVEMMVGRRVGNVERRSPDYADSATDLVRAVGLRGGSVHDATFQVAPGEVVGLLGLAGAGCSSLLRLLFGAQRAEGGELALDGESVDFGSPREAMSAGIALVPPERSQSAFPDHSVRENLTMASLAEYWSGIWIASHRERDEALADVERFSIRTSALSTPIGHLSGGNQQKVILARWLRRDPKLLLLDEPSQGVDIRARFDLWSVIRDACARGAGALVASSDIEELALICDRVLIVRTGRIVAEAGKPLSPERLTEMLHSTESQ